MEKQFQWYKKVRSERYLVSLSLYFFMMLGVLLFLMVPSVEAHGNIMPSSLDEGGDSDKGLELSNEQLVQLNDQTVEIAPERFALEYEGNKPLLPYASNKSIDERDESITKLIIAVHSLDYNALDYLENGIEAVSKTPEASGNTLVIAPHFLEESHIPPYEDDNLLHWSDYPFWGTERARLGPDHNKISLSAFKVTDELISYIENEGNFPNLQHIVVAGHSAGGQFVNRYAAANRYDVEGEKPDYIHMRYIVMAPSTYLYFDEHRVVPKTRNEFTIPDDPPDDYNDYGVGLQDLWGYLQETGEETIKEQFKQRNVYYLVGSEDDEIDFHYC